MSVPSTQSAFSLAALATTAKPGLVPVAAQYLPTSAEGIESALVRDEADNEWVVRATFHPAGGLKLQQEAVLLETLARRLPLALPEPVGIARLPKGGGVSVSRAIPGVPLQPGQLADNPELAIDLGRALAHVHSLPVDVLEEPGLPSYSAHEYRKRRLALVDRAAGTGLVPPGVLQRWETAMENVSAWRFTPTVIHNDLGHDTVQIEGNTVSGLTNWAASQVADPAEDFAWLLHGDDSAALDQVLAGYIEVRPDGLDPHLLDRAVLAAELSVARWLLYGVTQQDDSIIEDAIDLLAHLDSLDEDDDAADLTGSIDLGAVHDEAARRDASVLKDSASAVRGHESWEASAELEPEFERGSERVNETGYADWADGLTGERIIDLRDDHETSDSALRAQLMGDADTDEIDEASGDAPPPAAIKIEIRDDVVHGPDGVPGLGTGPVLGGGVAGAGVGGGGTGAGAGVGSGPGNNEASSPDTGELHFRGGEQATGHRQNPSADGEIDLTSDPRRNMRLL